MVDKNYDDGGDGHCDLYRIGAVCESQKGDPVIFKGFCCFSCFLTLCVFKGVCSFFCFQTLLEKVGRLEGLQQTGRYEEWKV